MKTEHECIRRVLGAQNSEELLAGYKDWAGGYDNDLIELGYVAPMLTAQALIREVDNASARILDAGCGTGLVGQCLAELGYRELDALDYSREMLTEARNKGVYKSHICADMNQALDIPANTYDAVICVGAFTLGHVRPEAMTELVRITRPGGAISFTVRDEAFQAHDYRSHMLKMEVDGAWEVKELRREDYIIKEESSCRLCTYRVAA